MMKTTAAAALLASALLTGPATEPVPLPAPAPAPEASTLTLTVSRPGADGTAAPGTAAVAAPVRTVVLSCDPAGGTHPRPEPACADLEATGGAIERPSDRACILLYDPVDVRAEGRWRGRAISFERRYGNDCEAAARTGSVFAF